MQNYDLPKRMRDQVVREIEDELRSNNARGEFEEGDPNHPKYNGGYNYASGRKLFGYDEKEFLAKQYK